MKLAIVGSRTFAKNVQAKLLAQDIIRNLIRSGKYELVSGGARGPDTWAEEVAEQFNVPITVYKPNWQKYGKSAGYRRNELIIADASLTLIFWDGKSKGTLNDIKICRRDKKDYRLFEWTKDNIWSEIERYPNF